MRGDRVHAGIRERARFPNCFCVWESQVPAASQARQGLCLCVRAVHCSGYLWLIQLKLSWNAKKRISLSNSMHWCKVCWSRRQAAGNWLWLWICVLFVCIFFVWNSIGIEKRGMHGKLLACVWVFGRLQGQVVAVHVCCVLCASCALCYVLCQAVAVPRAGKEDALTTPPLNGCTDVCLGFVLFVFESLCRSQWMQRFGLFCPGLIVVSTIFVTNSIRLNIFPSSISRACLAEIFLEKRLSVV